MTWKDLTVEQFRNIKLLSPNQFDSFFEYKKDLLSICCDINISEMDDWDIDEFDEEAKKLDFLFRKKEDKWEATYPSERYKNSITTQDITFHFIDDFNYLTLAEWIDLENYILSDYFRNFTKALALMYRIVVKEETVLFPREFEPYGLFARHRAHLFDEVKIEEVYGAVRKFIAWREDLLKRYHGLFKGSADEGNDKDLTEEEKALLTDTEQKIMKGEIEKERRMTKWNVELFLKNISDNDPTKVEALLKLNIIFLLNWKSAEIEIGAN